MSEPATKEEYEAKYLDNHAVSGYGIDGVTNHFPCPFCAAPDWHVVRVIDFAVPSGEGVYTTEPIKCEACGRSAKYVSERSPDRLAATIVQTDGPDPPEWVPIRRVAVED